MTEFVVLSVVAAVAVLTGWLARSVRPDVRDAEIARLRGAALAAEHARDEWKDLFLEERAQIKQLTMPPPPPDPVVSAGTEQPLTVGEADRIAVEQRRKEQARWFAGLEPVPLMDRDAVPVNRLTTMEFTE